MTLDYFSNQNKKGKQVVTKLLVKFIAKYDGEQKWVENENSRIPVEWFFFRGKKFCAVPQDWKYAENYE